ncbi:MAG TPA: thioredoxin fold domain-containing protein [Chitinophagaceae bacterium]|nr:thioredoxin fold domain-containing protein [Chitinophagaceae bacterium]
MRKWTVVIWLILIFGGIIALFWRNEWVYSLPTPIPKNYAVVNPGDHIDIAAKLNLNNNKPLFLHFFNPDCPCSRFNIPHFKSLVKQYGNEANFAIVIMSNKDYTEKEIQKKFDLSIPVLFDTSIAVLCGVYSTPQAVIIDANNKLYYRGNYNRSRYCTDKKSNYAQMALDSLLQNKTSITFNQFALKAYGCQLPKCTK